MANILRLFTLLLVTLSLGCAVLQNAGAPAQSFDENDDIRALERRYSQASALERYFDAATLGTCANSPSVACKTFSDCPTVACNTGVCSNSPSVHCSAANECPTVVCSVRGETEAARNEFITARLTLINMQYTKFIHQFAVSKSQIDTGFDMLTTGLGLATAVVGGEATKAALGAASAGVGATRTSIDKNFFFEKTVPVLVTAMNAQRKVALIPILQGMQQDIRTYPISQAASDLLEYYNAGTFIGALQAVQKDAGVKEEKADNKIEIVRTASAAIALASQEAIDKIAMLMKKIDQLSDHQSLELAKNPPVAHPTVGAMPASGTNAKAARDQLKRRIVQMQDPAVDLPKWEKALP